MLEILRGFCEAPSARFLHNPFTIGPYSYASNGHIAVRVPALADVSARPAEVKNDLERLPWPDESTPWESLPELPAASHECPFCEGRGRVVTCFECIGEGSVSWETDRHFYSAECEECDGAGILPSEGEITNDRHCPRCSGTGSYWDNEETIIAGIPFSVTYLAKIAQLPNPTIKVADIPLPNTEKHFLRFSSSNGLRGILMARRSKPAPVA